MTKQPPYDELERYVAGPEPVVSVTPSPARLRRGIVFALAFELVIVLLAALAVGLLLRGPGPAPLPTVVPTNPVAAPRASTDVPIVGEIGAPLLGGTATWLCDPPLYPRCTRGYPESSMVAAAGSEIAAWRGRWVRVRSGDRHVDVRLVDACACRGSRVIDLYAIAFRRLAPTSRGEIAVTVELLDPIRLPATDTEVPR